MPTTTRRRRQQELAPADPPVEQPETPEAGTVAEAGARLIKECSKVRVRVSWFGTTAKVDDEIAQDMLKDTDAERKSVSISKRLLSTKHVALEAVKEARKSIECYVHSMTVPMLLLTDANAGDSLRKDAGTRLIQKKDMAVFDERMQYLIGVLRTAVTGLQAALPEIKEQDREKLGRLFDESDYPTDVTKLVEVQVWYENANVDLDWEQLCPNIFARERAAATRKFEAVVENAAVEFADRFVKYVKQVVDQLGNRTRLNPRDGDPRPELAEAEVLQVLTHQHDPENIPEGMLHVEVRMYKGAIKGRSETKWLDPLRESDYHDNLRPYQTDERRKLYASTVENLKQELEAFLNIGAMLGPYEGVIKGSVDRVKDLLTRGSRTLDCERIAEELRQGSYFRDQMKDVLGAVAVEVQSAIQEVSGKRRRSISRSLMGKV